MALMETVGQIERHSVGWGGGLCVMGLSGYVMGVSG